MGSMRTITLLALFAAAAPAAAQPTQLQLDDLRLQQQNAERRAIDQANQMMALEARLRADQATLDLQLQRSGVGVPAPTYQPSLAPAPAAVVKPPSMSDAVLAESNRRVQAAARNRR